MEKLATELEILSLFECPVCQEILFPPIFLCIRGHDICRSCKPKLTECPLCKGKLTDARNFTAEKILSTFKYNCRNKVSGCDVKLTGERIESHLRLCPFRPIRCPRQQHNSCAEHSLNLTDAKKHFIEVHKADCDVESSQTRKFRLRGNYITAKTPKALSLRLTEWNGESFVKQVFIMKGNICFTVSHFGPENQPQKYLAKIFLQLDTKNEIQWTIPIVSIITTEEHKKREDIFVSSCSTDIVKQMTKKHESDYEIIFRVDICMT